MADEVPEVLDLTSLIDHTDSEKNENILKLGDPPATEYESLNVTTEEMFDDSAAKDSEKSSNNSNDELLDLHEPPEEVETIKQENSDISDYKLTDEAISEFAQNLIDPIVKEAIEIQKAEMAENTSDEMKVDSSGDKKSDKSLSDDGFEYLKADDINSTNNIDPNNEDDTFLHEDLKIEDSLFDVNNDSAYITYSSDIKPDIHQTDETSPFDLDGIIEASNIKPDEYEPENISFDPIVSISAPSEQLSEPPSKPHSELDFEPPKKEVPPVSDSPESDICKKCRDIFCWRHPILSAVVLSTILVIELGLMCDYSIITLIAYSGLLMLVSSFFYKVAVKFNLIRQCGNSSCSVSISGNDVQLCVDCVLKWVEYLYNEIRSLAYVTSFAKNIKAFTFFWILTYVGQWFNLLSLIFIGTIVLFSLPIIYITYKEVIDQVINTIRDHIKESVNGMKSKIRQLVGRRD